VARALGDLAARDGRPVALISGLLANKDATGFFAPFAPLGAKVFSVTFEGNAAASAAQTAAAAELAGLRAQACDSVERGAGPALALEPDAARADLRLAVPGGRGAGDESGDLAGLG
jgi:dihydrofolate synthase/folylpolyglutamate synthase